MGFSTRGGSVGAVVLAVLAGGTACSLHANTFTADDDGMSSKTATITVRRAGAATGSISAQDIALSCAETCTATVNVGTTVTLLASPDPGAAFGGWTGGGCVGTDPTCAIAVTEDVTVAAQFDVALVHVEVDMLGGGTGVVMSTLGDIVCPGMCSAMVPYNTTVDLVATPVSASTFTGWGGACSGTDTCSVTVAAATTITATFALVPQLSVATTGSGSGTVTSDPDGISCGTACSANFDAGTTVTLTAAPALGSTFTGWSSPCSGTGVCVVTLQAATVVVADFALVPPSSYTASFTGGLFAPDQCTSWNSFLGTLTSPSYNRVTISGTGDPTGVTCDDPVAATQLCLALHTGNTTVGPLSCNGRMWNVGDCGTAAELSADGNTCTCDNVITPPIAAGYIVRPCVGNENWGGVNTITCDAPTQTMTVVCE